MSAEEILAVLPDHVELRWPDDCFELRDEGIQRSTRSAWVSAGPALESTPLVDVLGAHRELDAWVRPIYRNVEYDKSGLTDQGGALVRLREGIHEGRLARALATDGIAGPSPVSTPMPEVPLEARLLRLQLAEPRRQDVHELVEVLRGLDTLVEHAEPDWLQLSSPHCAVGAVQPSKSDWGLQRVGVEEAWKLAQGGTAPVRVAVIDTGFTVDHAFYAEMLASGPASHYNVINPGGALTDANNGHGTRVMGVIAAACGVQEGQVSPFDGIRLVPIQVDYTSLSMFIRALFWASHAEHEIDVVNISLGWIGTTWTMWLALWWASRNERILVAASGNEAENNPAAPIVYPARHPAVIAVGAVRKSGARIPRSCYGEGLGLVAPGDEVVTTEWPKGACPPDGSTCYNDAWGGTSASAPFVAAAVAMLKAVQPLLSRRGMHVALAKTCDQAFGGYAYEPIASAAGAPWADALTPSMSWSTEVGYGFLNLDKLLKTTPHPHDLITQEVGSMHDSKSRFLAGGPCCTPWLVLAFLAFLATLVALIVFSGGRGSGGYPPIVYPPGYYPSGNPTPVPPPGNRPQPVPERIIGQVGVDFGGSVCDPVASSDYVSGVTLELYKGRGSAEGDGCQW